METSLTDRDGSPAIHTSDRGWAIGQQGIDETLHYPDVWLKALG